MNSIRCLVSLPAVIVAISSQAMATQQLPDRPAAVVTNHDGAWMAVVGVDANAPVVDANGSRLVLNRTAGVLLTPSDRYAGGFVTISEEDMADVPVTNDPDTASTMPNEMQATSGVLSASLASDVDIPGAYALLIHLPPSQDPDSPPPLAVVLHNIGDLKAGSQTHLSVVLPKIKTGEEPGWGILIFASGQQVRSTGMGKVLPGYFDRIETLAQKKRIAERVDKGADAPIAVFRKMPLGLPEQVTARYRGTTIKVEINVGADGRLIWAKPIGVNDADLWGALNKGFAGWLFLPPVREGAALPGSAIIPLKM